MRHPICERLIKIYRSARVWLLARRKFTRSRRYFIIYNRKYRYSRRNDARRIRSRTRKRNFSNARARVRERRTLVVVWDDCFFYTRSVHIWKLSFVLFKLECGTQLLKSHLFIYVRQLSANISLLFQERERCTNRLKDIQINAFFDSIIEIV
jgi:hypothetical protein